MKQGTVEEISIEKCLDLTTTLLTAALQSGKLEVSDGQALATFFDEVYAQVCDCVKLTSPAFIKQYTRRRTEQVTSST